MVASRVMWLAPAMLLLGFAGLRAHRTPMPSLPAQQPDAPAATPVPASPQEPLRVSGGQLTRLKSEAPVYPSQARRAGAQGQVVLDVTISPEGSVKRVEVIRGNPMLTEAARAAVQKWRYQPYLLNGKPSEVMTLIRVNFTLGKILDRRPAPPEVEYKEAAKRVRIAQGVSQGSLLHQVSPVYPEEAKRRGIEGTVVLKGIIDRNGHLNDLKVESGHSMLVESAVGAVEQWRYQPYLLDGVPVEVETTITVNFELRYR